MIIEVNGKFLIGFNNWRKQWEIPAGRIENGENARQTAIRELFEETHQKNEDIQFKGLFKKIRPNGEIVYFAIFYSSQNDIEEFIKKEDDENDEIKLWNLKDDIGYVDEIDLKIIKMICK